MNERIFSKGIESGAEPDMEKKIKLENLKSSEISPAEKKKQQEKNKIREIESQSPHLINFSFEIVGEIPLELQLSLKQAFYIGASALEKEYALILPIKIDVALMSDEKFREGSKPTDPNSWKYCFILRDQSDRDSKIYCNANIFQVLPSDARAMIKHETAHIIIGNLVNDISKYKRSFLLEEGSAGIDLPDGRLILKMRTENIHVLPSPESLKTIQDIKALGDDTNMEPFTEQLGYLVLFSFVDFLKNRYGIQKIIDLYKSLDENHSFEESYSAVCKEELSYVSEEWQSQINKLIKTY